jgi:AraC family transcriptional regulator
MLAKHPAIGHDRDSPRHSSRIQVVDVASGALWPVAHADWLVLASDQAPWQDSLLVEQHRKPPLEEPENVPRAHHIGIHLSPPSLLEYRIAGEWPRRQLVGPGGVQIAPARVPKWSRWQEPVGTLVLALKPAFVQQASSECAHPDRCEFMSRRGICDPQILHLELALQGELAAGCPGGRLYGEGLATALAVHLLQHDAVCAPELRSYRGGLPQAHLRRVLEYMQDHLDHELSLMALAAVAQMSP